MSAIAAIARQVWREAIRERALHTVGVYLAILAVLTPWVGDLALGAPERAARDLGLTLAWLLGSGTAIGLGIRAVGWTLHGRTAAILLARPISRGRWVIGRMVGVAAALAAQIGGLVACHALVLAAVGAGPTPALLVFGGLLWAECCVVAALAALLSALARPAIAATLSVGLWAAGHLADEYAVVAPVLARIVFTVVPDLDVFDVHAAVVHDDGIDALRTIGAVAYGAAWWIGLLALTTAAVSRRDVA